MGLLDMLANPQTAGVLGLAQGLLGASGPSRMPVSVGQGLGAGMGGMQEGVRNAYQLQQANMQNALMRARMPFILGALNGQSQGAQEQPAQPQQPVGVLSPDAFMSSGQVNLGDSSGGNPAAPIQSSPAEASVQTTPAGSQGMSMFGMNPTQLYKTGQAYMMTGDPGMVEVGKSMVTAALEAAKPTDATRMAVAAGVDPAAANLAAMKKSNYIAPTPLRSPFYVDPQSGQVQGVDPALLSRGYRGMYQGEAAGKADYTLTDVWDPARRQMVKVPVSAAVESSGATTPGERAIVQAESGGNSGAVSPKGAVGAWQVMPNTNKNPGFGVAPAADNSRAEMDRVGKDYYNAMVQRYSDPTLGAIAYNMGPGATDKWLASGAKWNALPQETRNYVGQVATGTALNQRGGQASGGAPMAASAPMGMEKGVEAQQSELSKKWTDLNAQNQQAQTTTSYLQNIKQLAQKAATGPQSDKLQYANGLLALVGNERATDATTANNLLDKYSNQIVSRLGTGGLGTDAARSILQSAYPNAHMTAAAINEAADNLIGANEMIKAKARLLSSHAANRDPVAYQNAEVAFDQNADPRLWQYKAIAGTPQGKTFLQGVLKQDPQFLQRAEALHGMGAY